jgi:CheY-like chemotaxis protein/anti-sigma regulatory factor (Ser/Thr protein kinase)
VLDVSKLDSGAVKPNPRACSINQIFDRLRSDFAPPAEDKGLALVVEPTSEGGRTDPDLLRRLLGNLLSNAIRYTPAGSVRLSCERQGDELVLTVRDTGVGIPHNELTRIFEEFYQVDRGSTRSDGLGLGLSIVQRLARLLGHTLSVESAVGGGTVFTIRVARAELVASSDERSPSPAGSCAKGRILVVDDEPSVAHATGLLLELEGFDVQLATCRRDALERALEAPPDLIVSDYHLRGAETGVEVVVALREKLRKSIPAVFVTGDTGKLALADARLDNASLLNKPTRADELIDTIRERLRTA